MTSKPVFDTLANEYDKTFSHTRLGHYYRKRVQKQMVACWPGRKHILELNAGTGEDAIFLARQGHHVVATDISENMLSLIKEKTGHHQLTSSITVQQLAIEALPGPFGQQFDGILSNFGGLNCVRDLYQFINNANSILKPGGIMILCVMGPTVPWEWGYYSVRGQFAKAFRRVGGRAHWRGADIYYPSVSSLIKMMADSFSCRRREALGVLMPPSYVSGTVERWPVVFDYLGRVEAAISHWLPMVCLADHYLLIVQKHR